MPGASTAGYLPERNVSRRCRPWSGVAPTPFYDLHRFFFLCIDESVYAAVTSCMWFRVNRPRSSMQDVRSPHADTSSRHYRMQHVARRAVEEMIVARAHRAVS